jgi:maltose O-acetyltransferase
MLASIVQKLARNRSTPLPVLAAKAARYLRETAAAALHLRACDRVGPGARVEGRPVVHNEGRIELGAEVTIRSRWAPVELATGSGGRLEIGDGASINYGTLVSATREVRIGKRVMMGNYCVVADTKTPGAAAGAAPGEVPSPIEIGDDVWLAVRVTVLPGARIGARTVVVAGSVVDSELPPDVIAGGVPARVLRASTKSSASAEAASGLPS